MDQKIQCGKHLTWESCTGIFKGHFNTANRENNFKANYLEKMKMIKIKESFETTPMRNISSK